MRVTIFLNMVGFILNPGEKGDKFYLIVQGAVDVMIPNPRRAPSTNIYAKLRKPSPVKI